MNTQYTNPSSRYVAFADQAEKQFIREVKREYGFRCGGSGGSMPYDVEALSIDLIVYRSVTLEEARELGVKLIRKYVDIVNAHEKVRPYLREYPFKASRVNLSLSFYEKNNQPQLGGSIYHLFQARNTLFYDRYDAESESLVEVHQEPYDEAEEIVDEKKETST